MADYSALQNAVIEGNWDEAAALASKAVDDDKEPQTIIDEELQPAMDAVGQKFSSGEYFLPDMLMAGRAMTQAMNVLQPLLSKGAGEHHLGKVVIGTVQGDVHDIGKNMVIMFLKGAGFEVTDLGTDVSDEQFVEAVRKEKPNIVGLSALLTTTMPNLGTVIKALEGAGLRSSVRVVVGGAPVTQDYADYVGADAYGHDAGQAARICKAALQ